MKKEIDDIYIDKSLPANSSINPMFYSGSAEAGLNALELGKYNARSVFLIGAYNSHSQINNSNIDLIVNVFGQNDGIAGFVDYRGSGVQTINIVFQGDVDHAAYFREGLPYNEFIAKARVEAAKGEVFLTNFLNQFKLPEVAWNEGIKQSIDSRSDAEQLKAITYVIRLKNETN